MKNNYEMKNVEVIEEVIKPEWHMPERKDRDTCVFENFSHETMTPDDKSVIKMARHEGCIGCSKYANDNCWASRVFAQTGRELMEARGLDIIPRVIKDYEDIKGYEDIKEKYNKFLDIVSKDETFQVYEEKHKDAMSIRTCTYVNIDQMLQDPDYAVQMYNSKNCRCSKDKSECFIHNFIQELAAIILAEVFGYDI